MHTAVTGMELPCKSAWEARVFASLCVAPTMVGSIDVRGLVTGEILRVALQPGESLPMEAAFLSLIHI